MKFSIFILFFLSCSSQTQFSSSQNVKQADVKILANSILTSMKDFKNNEEESDLKFLLHLNYKLALSNDDCDHGQIACTKPLFFNTIFITRSFFTLSPIDRLATLIHEGAHHFYHYYHHDKCTGGIYKGSHVCDVGLESSYGVEIKLYRQLLKMEPSNQEFQEKINLLKKNIQN